MFCVVSFPSNVTVLIIELRQKRTYPAKEINLINNCLRSLCIFIHPSSSALSLAGICVFSFLPIL